MSGYDSFLDAEYDAYCDAQDDAERASINRKIEDLMLEANDCVSSIKFYQVELGKAIDSDDGIAAYEAREFIDYDQAQLKAIEREIAELEEELAYLGG